MHQPDFKALVDMSCGTLGYCGFAQESRVLLKALFGLVEVEPTGLVFGRDDAVVNHRFETSSGQDGWRFENQALYIQALIDRAPPQQSRFSIIRRFQQLKMLWRITMARHISTDLLDSAIFWDAIWRGLLERSLSEADIVISQQCRMLLSNLGGRMLLVRNIFGLPAPHLDTSGYDFTIFHDCQPVQVAPTTCKLIRYYDMIPGVRPDLAGSRRAIQAHLHGIRRCKDDSIFVCNSEPTRNDLLRAFPELKERSVIIPHGVPDGYYPDHFAGMLPAIIRSRSVKPASESGEYRGEATSFGRYRQPDFMSPVLQDFREHETEPAAIADDQPRPPRRMPPYLLITAVIEPRKNHVTLIRAFEKLIARHRTDLRLIIVGQPGWKYAEALKAMGPLIRQGRVAHLVDVPTQELRLLYTHAEAMVFPSLYEGFGYGPLEAMACETPAVVSDIAAHRWVYGDAAHYFDPYRVDSLVETLEGLLFAFDTALRQRLVETGAHRVKRYSVEAVGAQWLTLFQELRRQGITSNVKDARLDGFGAC